MFKVVCCWFVVWGQGLLNIISCLQEEGVCTISSATTGNNNNNNQNLANYLYLNLYTCLLTVQVSLTTKWFWTSRPGIIRQAVNNARVVINIFRNENDPFFINTPYRTTISESSQLGTSVLTVSARDSDDAVCAIASIFVLPALAGHHIRIISLSICLSACICHIVSLLWEIIYISNRFPSIKNIMF